MRDKEAIYRHQGFTETVRAVLAQRHRQVLHVPDLVCAAVLIPLVYKNGEWHIVVTQRTELVKHHRGQISFPGGACELGDADLLATALRETHEELGIPADLVEVLGTLDDMQTITDFVITPFVGALRRPTIYHINEVEVQEAIEVPLSFLLDPSKLRVEHWEREGQSVAVLFWDYGPYTIWGATARILRGFLNLIAEA
jgi:8-oxo-dGTP pyrophosphatase MutT (NUDIX family)